MKNQGSGSGIFCVWDLPPERAAYGAGLLGLPGCGSSGAAGSAPTDYYQLNVGYSERMLGGYRVRTRTYNGSLPGPVMTTRPGNHLWVDAYCEGGRLVKD